MSRRSPSPSAAGREAERPARQPGHTWAGALRPAGRATEKGAYPEPSALWQNNACGRDIRRFRHGLPEASRPRSQPDRGPPVAGRLSAGRRRIVSGTRPDGIFFAALKKTPRGRPGDVARTVGSGTQEKGRHTSARKGWRSGKAAETPGRRIGAEKRRVHARNRSRKQREKGTQKKRSSASSPVRDRISRRRLGGRLPGRPSSPDTKMPPTWGEAAASPRREPRQGGGRGHAWLRRSSRRRGKSGGGEEAYVPTFQCSKSVIAISDFFVNCFFENSFHRPFLLSSSFKNASNAAFFPILQCRNASCAGKAALLPPGKSDWKKCRYRVILVY